MNVIMSVDVSKVLADLRKKGNIEPGIRNGFEQAGLFLEAKMVEKINSNIPPKLADATIARKGSSLALVDTGEMRDAITSQLEGDGVNVGIIGDGVNALKGAVHEFGSPARNIPERSWARSATRENQGKIFKIFSDEVARGIETH